MAITPADIEQQTFSPSKHGYDTEEVDAFLEQLSAEVDAMLQKIADLKGDTLRFEVRETGKCVDPLKYLNKR